MSSPTITRRALITGAGTAIASAALAVPFVSAMPHDAADPQSISPAAIKAIAEWNIARDVEALAWANWDQREVRVADARTDDRYLHWLQCREGAHEAQAEMLRQLRATVLDLNHIYRRA